MMSLEYERDESKHEICEACLSCLCCCWCKCCCLEKGEYDCCKMTGKVCNGQENCDRECMQLVLCDDESSACCRTAYYIALCLNIRNCLNCVLPSCSRCHQVKALEKGMCCDCWDYYIDEFEVLHEKFESLNQRFENLKFDEPKATRDQLTSQNLIRLRIHTRDDARKWLIVNHPDKCHHPVDIDDFKLVHTYYKSCNKNR